eukprot:12066105-Alexandrium_andersonii.AAC.1
MNTTPQHSAIAARNKTSNDEPTTHSKTTAQQCNAKHRNTPRGAVLRGRAKRLTKPVAEARNMPRPTEDARPRDGGPRPIRGRAQLRNEPS